MLEQSEIVINLANNMVAYGSDVATKGEFYRFLSHPYFEGGVPVKQTDLCCSTFEDPVGALGRCKAAEGISFGRGFTKGTKNNPIGRRKKEQKLCSPRVFSLTHGHFFTLLRS